MGARLQLFWGRWAEIRADEWVTEVLHYGYRIPFMSTPPLASEPIPFQSYHHNTERFEVLDAEIADMEKKQAIEEVRVPGPGFYSRMFVVPRASGGFRPVTDLSLLNKYINLSKFKIETSKMVLSSIRKGDWMVSIDLKDAYFHIPIHPDSRKYLRFVWKGRVWQFRSLCFGLSTAPQVFTRVMASVAAALHREGYRVLRYLDDWLILHEEETGIALARDRTLFWCDHLGLLVNRRKSLLIPTNIITYLGMVIHSVPMMAFPTQDRVDRMRKTLSLFLKDSNLPAGVWLRLLGHLSSLEKLVPGGRLRMRALQFCLNEAWSRSQDKDHRVKPSREALRDLVWWNADENIWKGLSLQAVNPEFTLFTDASSTGWGGAMQDLVASGEWSVEEKDLHINVLELRAVRRVLETFVQEVRGKALTLMADNSTALAYIKNQGGTKSKALFREAQVLFG